jgi:hypothetical protein
MAAGLTRLSVFYFIFLFFQNFPGKITVGRVVIAHAVTTAIFGVHKTKDLIQRR